MGSYSTSTHESKRQAVVWTTAVLDWSSNPRGELEQVVPRGWKPTWKPPAQIHPHSYSASWWSSSNRPNIRMKLRHKRQQAEHELKQMSYLRRLLSVVSLPWDASFWLFCSYLHTGTFRFTHNHQENSDYTFDCNFLTANGVKWCFLSYRVPSMPSVYT